ncbi:MAG: hypothetical protein IJ231_03820 [Clostridia bacterium]|nr:hypothetical protein [Clostridia bacterium]
MEEKRTKRNTRLFVAFLLLAGVMNLLSRSGIAVLEALCTGCNYLIYMGLLIEWFQSVRARLLPSRTKNLMVSAALLLLLYQMLRVFCYRFATEPPVIRFLICLYFTPMTLIPTLFLMICLHIRRGRQPGRRYEALLLIPPALLSLIALTNDLHGWVYRPKIDLAAFAVDTGTYSHGPVFYAIYAWMILSLAAGFVLLFRETRAKVRKALPYLIAVAGLWLVMLTLFARFFDGTTLPRMYNNPDIHMFGMLGVLEVCIRHHLIPHNAGYADMFAALRTPALVTDEALQSVYRSGGGLEADREQLRAALSAPVWLTPDLKLSGRAVRGGYAFWAEDEAEVHLAQDRLEEANELIESENSLIRAETEQREKDAWLQSRHRIYHEIAETLYPCQQRIEVMLGRMKPNTPAFRTQLAQVSVLNAFVKRKTNLLLLAAEQDSLTTCALFLALKESAVYLSLAGLQTDAQPPEEEQTLPAAAVTALYEAFEEVAEALVGKTSSLMVSWRDGALVLAAEAAPMPELSGLPVPARVREEDGILYLDLLAGAKGGERA